MSFQDPGTDAQLDQDIAVPTPRTPGTPGTARQYIAAFAAAAVGVTAVGAGIWAWRSFMSQGDQPAQALPANTLAYASLDLNPPGGQKLAAYNALKKFPSIKRELGLDSADDVQKSVVDQLTSDSGCGLSYATMKSWLGDRMAAAVVPQKKPEAVAVLQLSDEGAARTGLTKASADCHFGFSIHDGWAVLARNTAVASQVSKDAASGNLDEHADFKRLTGAAGEPGLVTLYAAPAAGQALLDAIDDDPFSGIVALQMVNGALDPVTSFATGFGLLSFVEPGMAYSSSSSDTGEETFHEPKLTAAQKQEQAHIAEQYMHYEELTKEQQAALDAEQEKFFEKAYGLPGMHSDDPSADGSGISVDGSDSSTEGPPDEYPAPQISATLKESLKKFTGLGGIGRIAGGAVEVEIVGDQLGGTSAAMYGGNKAKGLVTDLPKNSAVAFGAGLAKGWVDVLFDQIATGMMYTSTSKADVIKRFEKDTGLDVPGDLEALGGDGVSIVAGPGLSLHAFDPDPATEPVAARITGDATKIEAALDKVRAGMGSDGSKLLSRRVDGDVVVTMDASFLSELAGSGDLGDTDTFHQVVPGADDAASVFFVNFDAGDWLAKQVSGSDKADAEPLRGFGMSVTKSDGQQHIRMRLSFD